MSKSLQSLPDSFVKVVTSCGVAGGRDDGEQGGQGEDEAVHRHNVLRHLLVIEFTANER